MTEQPEQKLAEVEEARDRWIARLRVMTALRDGVVAERDRYRAALERIAERDNRLLLLGMQSADTSIAREALAPAGELPDPAPCLAHGRTKCVRCPWLAPATEKGPDMAVLLEKSKDAVEKFAGDRKCRTCGGARHLGDVISENVSRCPDCRGAGVEL